MGFAINSLDGLVNAIRDRVFRSTTSPFAHAPYPLAHTLGYEGDPGLLGPGSVSWSVIGDIAALVGGIRGLLIQAAHPEVVAGVGDHSRYRDDPLGRLSRTSAYVTATTFGAMAEVEQAVGQVRRIHRFVEGTSSRGSSYSADDPAFSVWVHNALTDSFLVAHQAYGGIRLNPSEADRFVLEQTRVGALLGSDPMPKTVAELGFWIENHPGVEPSPEMRDAMDFLTNPPLDPAFRLGYRILLEAAVATIPTRLRSILGLTAVRGAVPVGKTAVAGLRWALGYSPSWRVALMRCGEPLPEGLFIQEPRSPERSRRRVDRMSAKVTSGTMTSGCTVGHWGRTDRQEPAMSEPSLILVDIPDGQQVDTRFLEGLGHSVAICHGPGPRQLCPILSGEGCEMAEGAHGVVFLLDLDRPQHRAILKQYKDILRDDVPVGVKVSIEQARKYPDLLKGIHVWTGIPVAGDLDGFAAEVEAAEQSW